MDAHRWRRYIGGWELIAGAFGLVATLVTAERVGRLPGVPTELAAMAVLSAVSAVGGYALLKGRAHGRVLSLWALGSQVLGFNVGFATWHLLLGPYLQLRLVLPANFGVDVGATVQGTVWLGESGAVPFFTLNVAAFAAFIYLVGQADVLAAPTVARTSEPSRSVMDPTAAGEAP